MSNPINIDHNCNQAIRREIGKQLRVYLRVSSRLPARLRKQVDRLDKLEGQSPQAFPKRNMGSKTSQGEDASRGGCSRLPARRRKG